MQRLIFTILFSFLLSLLMSAWVTYINLGLSSGYVMSWLEAFSKAWPAALLIAYFLAPPITRFASFITKKVSKNA